MATTTRIQFPSIQAVAAALRGRKPWVKTWEDVEVRLQVYDDGNWAIRTGDPSFDLDHNGFWGVSYLQERSNCRELARELIDQCRDHAAQCGD